MGKENVYMDKTIQCALRGSGFVNPDPLSAATIVKNNKIISLTYHHKSNRDIPVAIEAINKALESTNGSEIYLNIEPNINNLHIDSFIQAFKISGIQKVFIGMLSPINTSKVVRKLQEIGLEVHIGPLTHECQELNEIYAHYVIHHTPFVFVKWAMTLDGKLASRTGDSKWISSDESLTFVHHLRQRVSAIMVGEGTVIMDNPLLTTRIKNVEISNPLRVVLSKYGNIPNDANVLKIDDFRKTLIIASENIFVEREKFLQNIGAKVIKLKEEKGKINFTQITKVLGELGIDSLYIEGGSGVLASAFESGIVHKVYAAVAPKIIGGASAITPVGGIGIERMCDAIELQNVSHEVIGRDVIIKGYIGKK